MTVRPAIEPACSPSTSRGMETIIEARSRAIGGLAVRRLLPAVARRMVGPFIFFDHLGPATLAPGRGIDVRPHPHIGLATVTYLFDGEIIHRDSLGSRQAIRPGEINWMTAGRGIVHSERTSTELRASGTRVHGLQLWVALPIASEEADPAFHHHAAGELPALDLGGVSVRVLAGTAYRAASPVQTSSPLFYVDLAMPAGAEAPVPDEHQERAVYVVDGELECGDQRALPGRMAILVPGAEVRLRAITDTRVVLVGGAPIDGPRHIWWNFVSSSRDRIEQAKRDWAERRFPLVPGDEEEFVPLPE